MKRTGSLVLAAVVGLAASLLLGRQEPSRGQPAEPAVAAPLVGTASCAGRSCHGSVEPLRHSQRSAQNEFTFWSRNDPHANAYDVLLEPRSREIYRRLKKDGSPETSPLCLGCHTTPAAAVLPSNPAAVRLVLRERTFGVGCEACHGNAGSWLDAHIAKGWDKAHSGMIDVADPATLAKRCAGCHVGAPAGDDSPVARDVDHDLIAAGHPRLAFEFSSYFANLPPHWPKKEFDEGRRWAVGQVAVAESALRLLDHRAKSGPWPELAEFDCFACHHDLAEPSWRQQFGRQRDRRPGAPAWGSWYFPGPLALAEDLLPGGPSKLPGVESLKRQMQRLRAKPETDNARRELAALRAKLPAKVDPALARQWRDRLLTSERFAQAASWDASEQWLLGLFALNHAAGDAPFQRRLESLLPSRAFSEGMHSPLSGGGGFDPAKFRKALRDQ